MEFLEIIFILFGRNYSLLNGATCFGIYVWNFIMLPGFCANHIYCDSNIDFWRSGSRVAESGMYHFAYRWNPTAMYWYYWTIFIKDLS